MEKGKPYRPPVIVTESELYKDRAFWFSIKKKLAHSELQDNPNQPIEQRALLYKKDSLLMELGTLIEKHFTLWGKPRDEATAEPSPENQEELLDRCSTITAQFVEKLSEQVNSTNRDDKQNAETEEHSGKKEPDWAEAYQRTKGRLYGVLNIAQASKPP